MRIAIYDKNTGVIKRVNHCLPENVETQCLDGEEFYLNCPEEATHILNNDAVVVPTPLVSMDRSRRNAALQASDWTQLPDVSLSAADVQAWAAYRKALRDMDFTLPVLVWPVAPSS